MGKIVYSVQKADNLHHLMEHFLGGEVNLRFLGGCAVCRYKFNYIIPKTMHLGDPFLPNT